MNYVLNHITSRWRWFTFVLFVAMAGSLATLSFSDASARQRRESERERTTTATGAERTAVHVVSDASSAFTFSNPLELSRPPIPPIPGGVVSLKDQDAEPEIKIDIFGNIYITAIHGVPGGVDLWKSTDKGATFVYLGEPDGAQDKCGVQGTSACTAGAGGGDDSIDVSSGGYLYISSLYLGGTTLSTSFDGGVGGAAPGQAWQVNPAANGNPPVPVNDRQWVAAYGPQTVYMTFDNAPVNAGIWFTKSTDAGKTFSLPVNLTGGAGTIRRSNNLAVDQYNGNLYTTYTPTNLPNQLNLLKSTDGGNTWTISTIYTGPAGSSVENAFPIIAVDRGGNVHVVFTRSTGLTARTNAHVFLMSSADQGATWLPPVQVDSGANTQSTVMPWIVAGSPGVVDITWYGSSSASPDAPPYDWHVFFAQTTNALSASPTFTQVVAVPYAVHNDAICSQGGNCTGSTRDLSEYYTMTIDRDGNANIAYEDGVTDCTGPPASNCYVKTWYIKQTGGASALTPPSPPGPAAFSANVAVGSPGGEPCMKVDSHNCMFITTPGNPWVWKSTNNGASFLSPVNPVADRVLNAGDEDILPIRQTSGARPDLLYFADLAQLTSINIAKSIDGGATWFAPGTGGAAGNVDASSDRQWLTYDRNVPANGDLTVYEMDHEAAAEAVRFNALTNDGAWSPPASGITAPEMILPPNSTFPNTNPGPVFVDPATHVVYGIFTASTVRTNQANPPFGKLPNVWEAFGAPPAAAGAPPGPFTNVPVYKGVQDSPDALPSPAPTPDPAVKTYGNNTANDFPAAAIDKGGNIYVAWAMNNARTNEYMVWMAMSHDHGQSFYGPFQVSQGPGAAVMPWVAAGDTGRIDVVYYATTSPVDPNIASNTVHWNTMFAQSLNANSREPVFTISQVSDHIMHNGPICNQGLLCASGTRTLADFFQVDIGPDGLANVAFADNGSTSTHVTFARQTSGPLALLNPTFPTCLPGAPTPLAVVSRKTHGTAGDFDVDLLTSPGIECRTGGANGDHKIVVTFPLPVTITGASVSSGTGSVSSTSVSGNVVTINLTGVTNAQRLTISLNGVTDANGSGNVPINMSVLAGDTTADGLVNSADISQTKSQSGQLVTGSNFREDLTADGNINSADIALAKSKSGTGLP